MPMPNGAFDDHPALSAAIAERAKVDVVRTEAERQVAYWDNWIREYRRLVGSTNAPKPDVPPPSMVEAEGRTVRGGKRAVSIVNETAEVAESVIERLGRPTHIGELHRELAAAGLEIGGKNPNSTLSARLSQSGRFVAVSGKGWWIRGRPLPGLALPIEPEGEGLDAVKASSPSSPSAGLGNHEPPVRQG